MKENKGLFYEYMTEAERDNDDQTVINLTTVIDNDVCEFFRKWFGDSWSANIDNAYYYLTEEIYGKGYNSQFGRKLRETD